MRHAREDYNRFQDPAQKDASLLWVGCTPIAEDEPVFLIRAQDISAPDVVAFWAMLNHARGNHDIADIVDVWATEIKDWQILNAEKVKEADLPKRPSARNAEMIVGGGSFVSTVDSTSALTAGIIYTDASRIIVQTIATTLNSNENTVSGI